jgi:hypothetical protein
VTIVRPDAAGWQAHPTVPGVTLKRRHAASEEVLVISGLASVGSFELRAGEYCRAESESVHDPVTTATGCTLFVCGSEHDEFLDEP